MTDWLDRVRVWYDRDPEAEWQRLGSHPEYVIEQLVTLHALKRHLPPPGPSTRILDAGGGPGRYTIILAERGYRMTLLDLSPGIIALARRKIAEAGPEIAGNVEEASEGSFTDLSRFNDAGFDAVLCLGGAFSHAGDAAARSTVLAEMQRVARPGAPLLISGINLLGLIRNTVQQQAIWDTYFPSSAEAFWQSRTPAGDRWPSQSFVPEEFIALLEGAGLEMQRLYGAQGIAAQLSAENLQALMADPMRWPAWRELLLATSDHPNIVGVSSSLLAVARSRA